MTSLDWRGLLCRGFSWEIKPCRRKILCSRKQYFPALEVDLEPQGLTVRVGKGGVENFLSWPSSCRDGCGSLFTAVLVYDACKGRKNLFKRSWKEGKRTNGNLPHTDGASAVTDPVWEWRSAFGREKLLLPQKSKAGGSNRGKCSRSRKKTAGVLRGYLQNSYYPERPILKIVQRQWKGRAHQPH